MIKEKVINFPKLLGLSQGGVPIPNSKVGPKSKILEVGSIPFLGLVLIDPRSSLNLGIKVFGYSYF